MAALDDPPATGPWWKRLAWLGAIWAGSVLALGVVAYGLRLAIK